MDRAGCQRLPDGCHQFHLEGPGRPDAPTNPGHRFVIAVDGFADQPPVHEYRAEMTREVFATAVASSSRSVNVRRHNRRSSALRRPGPRGELNMVFQSEHVSVDQSPTNRFDYRTVDLVVMKEGTRSVAGCTGGNRVERSYWNNHDQPRVVSRFGDDGSEYWTASGNKTVALGMGCAHLLRPC